MSYNTGTLSEHVECFLRELRPEATVSEKRARTIVDIIDAFVFLGEHMDIKRITVKMVAEKAGFSRTTFYEHFKDVFDVVEMLGELLNYHFKLNISDYVDLYLTIARKERVKKSALIDLHDMLVYYGKYVIFCLKVDKDFEQKFKENHLAVFSEALKATPSSDIKLQILGKVFASASMEGFLAWLEHKDMLPSDFTLKTNAQLLKALMEIYNWEF